MNQYLFIKIGEKIMKVNTQRNKFLAAQEKIRELSLLKFTDKQLRGLSKYEKQFIIENNYHVQIEQVDFLKRKQTMYMFIANDSLGRKRLYAITKKQSIQPNETKMFNGYFNYECWLVFEKDKGFSKFNFERRFCKTPNVRLIFV